MAKYRKKPVVVEATQLTEEVLAAHKFDGLPLPDGLECVSSSTHPGRREIYSYRCIVDTLEGKMDARIGDWIITGVKGGHYPLQA